MDIIGNLKISIFLVLIILLAVFTRYYNLNKNPGFYGDECCYGEVGYNLVRGKLQYEGIKPTFFSTFMTQPPVFPVIAGFFSFILGKSILITRVISALSSLVTVLLIFLITREMCAKRGGICAILFFILHPKTLLINRYGFTYNLGMVFLLATLFFAIKYSRTKNKKYLILSTVFGGINLITVYYAVALILWLVVFVIVCDPKRIYVPISGLLPIFVLLGYFFIFDREILTFDLKSMFSMASGDSGSLKYLPLKYIKLFLMDPFFIICFAGFFLNSLAKKEKWIFSSFFLFSSFEILRQREDVFILYYPAIFFIPLLHISVGFFIEFLLNKLSELQRILKISKLEFVEMGKYGIYLLVIVLAFYYFYVDMRGLTGGFDYQITKLSTGNVRDISSAVEFLNKNSSEDLFILTSIPVGFFLACPHASLLQSAAYMGYETVFFSEIPDRSRFYYDLTYSKAGYLVVLDVDRNWTLTLPGVSEIINSIRDEKWELVFKKGEVEIYENPAMKK